MICFLKMRMNSCCRFFFVMLLICCLHLHIKNKRQPVSFVCSESTDTPNKSSFKNDNEPSSGNNKDNLLSDAFSDSSSNDPLYLPRNVSSEHISRTASGSFPVDFLNNSDDVLAAVLNIFLKCLRETNTLNGQRQTLHKKLVDLKVCCAKSVPENVLNKILNDVSEMLNTYMTNIRKESTRSGKTTDRSKRFQNAQDEDSGLADKRSGTNTSALKTSDGVLSDRTDLPQLLKKSQDDGTFSPEEVEGIMKSNLSSLWQKGSTWDYFSSDEQVRSSKNYRPNSRPNYGTRDMSRKQGCQAQSDMKLIYDTKPFNSGSRKGSGLHPRNMFFYFLLECSTSNMGSGDSTIQCLRQKLREKGASMTEQCLKCFKESVECGKSKCMWSCMFGSACRQSCVDCGIRSCKAKLVQCTGLTNLPDACS